VEIRLLDPDGAPVPTGQAGEIWTRGPDLCVGYTDPALGAEAFDDDGWYRTGDMGFLDADGYLTISDRLKDVIIRGGENISAAEVEHTLEAHPVIREAVAVGYPDATLGERVCAFVVSDEPFDLERCRAWFAERGVARFKTPEQIRRVDAMPVLAAGKVDRAALKTRAAHPEP
jgi:cyclohexanecarboxylate-CoA ligase